MILGSSMLELALGMIFFYFLLSTLCSHVNELIAGVLDWRSKELIKGIRDVLNLPLAQGDDDPPPGQGAAGRKAPETLADRLLAHSMIVGLGTKPSKMRRLIIRDDTHRAAYIPAQTFSLAILDILANAKRCDDHAVPQCGKNMLVEAQQQLQHLPRPLREAFAPLIGGVDDLETARRNLEKWFNTKMDRLTGAYKRWTQLVLLILGAITSVALNADTVAVGRALWVTPTLRQVIAAQAQQVAVTPQTVASTQLTPHGQGTGDRFTQIEKDLQNVLVLPIGWGKTCVVNSTMGTSMDATGGAVGVDHPNCVPQTDDVWSWLRKLLGFVATTLAISLGAPFWFDLLQNVSNLRSSGPPPKEAESTRKSGAAA